MWLSIAETNAEFGYLVPLPHFPLATTTFALEEEVSCRHLFVTLVLDREQGTVVEIHSLGRAKELLEKLKFLHGAGTLSVVDENLLTLRVPNSKCLFREPSHLTAALMEDQFDVDSKKEEDRAESRSYAVLLVGRVLSFLFDFLNFFPQKECVVRDLSSMQNGGMDSVFGFMFKFVNGSR